MQEVIAITLFFQKVSRKVGDEIIHPYYKLNSYSNLVGSQGNECHLHLEDPQMPKCISLLGKILGNYIICNTVPSFRAFFCFWWNLNALIYVRGPFPWASKSQLFPSAWSSHSTYSCTYFEKSLPIHSKKCMCAGYLEMDFARISQFLRVQAGHRLDLAGPSGSTGLPCLDWIFGSKGNTSPVYYWWPYLRSNYQFQQKGKTRLIGCPNGQDLKP